MKTLSGIYAISIVKLTDKMDELCVNGGLSVQEPSEWKVFSKQFSIKINEDGVLILGQNDRFCGHNAVNFSVWFL